MLPRTSITECLFPLPALLRERMVVERLKRSVNVKEHCLDTMIFMSCIDRKDLCHPCWPAGAVSSFVSKNNFNDLRVKYSSKHSTYFMSY